jgi:PKD repeat protein
MFRGTVLLLVAAATVALPAGTEARRVKKNGLLRVVAPVARGTAIAHPFINVIVSFGHASNGTPADPATFKAQLGRRNITRLFTPVEENGAIVGMRAKVDQPMLRIGQRAANRLRFTVRGVGKRRRLRDVDRLRFRVLEGPNAPPEARAATSTEVLLPGVPVQFDATGSHDPDQDEITYRWDFGDGTTSDDPNPQHAFAETQDPTRTVTLTVDDGQASATATLEMFVTCEIDPGRTPGVLQVESAAPLEMGAVPLGEARTATITLRNASEDPMSQLCVRLGTTSSAFTVTPDDIPDLGPKAETTVTLTYAPTTAGHDGANVTIVASATNRPVVHALTHGFGGAAPGWGPTLVTEPLFAYDFGFNMLEILPSGQQVVIDTNVLGCGTPDGFGTGDVCLVPHDCDIPGENVCGGSPAAFEPIDFCGDGEGGLFLLSDEGTYTSPDDTNDLLNATMLSLQFDANGTRTGGSVLSRVNGQTSFVACDRRSGAQGRLYIPEYYEIDNLNSDCFRDAEERLTLISRKNGSKSTRPKAIDLAVTHDECDGDLDEVGDIEVTRDGQSAFVSFQNAGGIYRIAGPSPTPLEIVPDIDSTFQVHPDGAVLVASVTDQGTTALVSLYKIFPEQATTGAVPLALLTPCATFPLHNNHGFTRLGDFSIAAAPPEPGSNDAIVLVSFIGSEGPPDQAGQPTALSRQLRVQGTVAFASPAGATSCTSLGLVNVQLLDPMSF